MSGINFLSENYLDDSTLSITTGAANSQFPLDNLKIDFTTKKFRSTGNAVVILVDLLTTRPIDTIAVVGDATGIFGITSMSIKTSVTTDFSGSSAVPITLSAEFNIGFEFITEVTHRYVEITLAGTGSFNELGKVFIGQRINLPNQSLSIDSFRYRNIDQSSIKRNVFGQKFVNVRNYVKRIQGSLNHNTKAEQEILDDLYTFHGRHKPLWLILDQNSEAMNDGKFKLSFFCYFNRRVEWSASGGQTYSGEFSMEQVV